MDHSIIRRPIAWLRGGRPVAGSAAVLLALSVLAGPVPQGVGAEPATDTTTVTLVTGDQVLVTTASTGDQTARASSLPFDRRGATFHSYELDGSEYVVPSDAAPLVPDLLDRELFNVTKLVEYGYTERVPVIVTHPGEGERSYSLHGMSRTATLPSIDATAATIDSDGDWWTSLTDCPTCAAGIGKVWLDELAEVTLAESVPMIGAPQAWAAGYDGDGVTVAVLDSGIDADHPDLTDRVVAAENFTAEPDADDGYGHGTHVAGIVAGGGSASEGAYTGVAPRADLVNGKVCTADGNCLASDVIAGMEWAATRADVVNLSLGTMFGSDGTDPMSQAVNALTAEYDALFVVAAGNAGVLGAGSVGSPGAADAALTVGAVTKAEQLAEFSSHGPRLGDFAIKPDLTAPGVDIVSSRAGGLTPPGTEPVGEHYLRASGTSMAAPHVAGAAAIVLQQRPDLTASELKAALTTTAVPHDGLSVYEQGGGRLDVAAAVDARLRATPAPLDFGFVPWPHDEREPVSKTVTYTNLTDSELTVRLSLRLIDEEGEPLDPTAVTLTPETFTLAPHGTTEVDVAIDTNIGDTGVIGGYLVATTPTGEVLSRTPTGITKEHEVLTSGFWRHRQKLTPTGDPAEAFYGRTVSVDGDTALVGAAGDPVGGDPGGAVYVLSRKRGEWVERTRLTASDGGMFAAFGAATDLDDDTAIVGAPTATVDEDFNRGAAYIFTRSRGTWIQRAKLVAPDGDAGHGFGGAVAIHGDTALVGAVGAGSQLQQGVVYVFTRHDSGWAYRTTLTATDAAGFDNFGYSLELTGDLAVIGAPYKTVDGDFFRGAVYVFARSGQGWVERARLAASDGGDSTVFGGSVAASENRLLIGAPGTEVGNVPSQGAAYVFAHTRDGWSERAKLVADRAGNQGGEFGRDVAIEDDTALVGSPFSGVGSNAIQGAAWVFTRTATGWDAQAKLTAADGRSDDFLGAAIDLSDGTAFAGAWLADIDDESCTPGDPSCGEQGALYVFSPVTFDDLEQRVDEFRADRQVTVAGAARLRLKLWLAEHADERGSEAHSIRLLREFQEIARNPKYVPGELARETLVEDAEQLIVRLRT